MPPRNTLWDIEPHTLAKHQILLRYWQAWLPIMASWNRRLLYIDGFAGPGQYEGGEPGSPVLALDAAATHTTKITSELVFLFVEADEDRAQHLQEVLMAKTLPANFKHRVVHGTFESVTKSITEYLDEQKRRLAPALVFIDPFGYSDTPFDLVKKLMSNPHCEVLITFMYQFINRFVSEEGQWSHLDRLYGTEHWRTVLGVKDSRERKMILHGVYKRQLEQQAGAKYVLPFEMEDPCGKTEYFLFFCTNSLEGLARMKQAMWKADPSGQFRYAYSANANQLRLISDTPEYARLRTEIVSAFGSRTVSVEEIEEFVLTQTPFCETHYKRQVLALLEKEEQIVVLNSSRQRRYAYPAGTVIKFTLSNRV